MNIIKEHNPIAVNPHEEAMFDAFDRIIALHDRISKKTSPLSRFDNIGWNNYDERNMDLSIGENY